MLVFGAPIRPFVIVSDPLSDEECLTAANKCFNPSSSPYSGLAVIAAAGKMMVMSSANCRPDNHISNPREFPKGSTFGRVNLGGCR